MKKIGLLSDTHGFIDEKIINFFKDCDEIWHAGDIGSMQVVDTLSANKIFRAVYGNIDGTEIRQMFPEINRFKIDEIDVLIKHIGGYPKNYDKSIKTVLLNNPPNLFISGHSHILKVMYDDKINCLHINPGAAGNSGWHTLKTAVRFKIENKNISDLELFEIKRSYHTEKME